MKRMFAGIPAVMLALLLALPAVAAGRRARAPGKLQISSMTDGATVMVDGKEVGTIPLPQPLRLAPGKHTLKITKRGFTEYLDVFTIRARKTTVLDIDLLPFAGVLVVSSNETDSQVFVDGKFAGKAPLEKEVLIGKHTVRVRKPGYYNFIKTFNCIAGKVVELKVDLKAMPVGSTPYRPTPPPPPKWYEKWYVWAGAAGGLAAVTLAVVIPVLMLSGDEVEDFGADYRWSSAP